MTQPSSSSTMSQNLEALVLQKYAGYAEISVE
jgi:hypothetical protein